MSEVLKISILNHCWKSFYSDKQHLQWPTVLQSASLFLTEINRSVRDFGPRAVQSPQRFICDHHKAYRKPVNGEGITSHYISRNLHVLDVNRETVKHTRTSDMLLAPTSLLCYRFLQEGAMFFLAVLLSFVLIYEYFRSQHRTKKKQNNVP